MSSKASLFRAIALGIFTLMLIPIAANAAPPKNVRWYSIDMQPAIAAPQSLFISQTSDGVRLQHYRSGDPTQQWTPYQGKLQNRASGRCLAFAAEPGFARVATRPCQISSATFIAADMTGGYSPLGAAWAGKRQCMDSLSHVNANENFLVPRDCRAPKDKLASFQRFRFLQAG